MTVVDTIANKATKIKKDNANLTKIQAPSTVQSRTPQLQRSSYSDIQAFSDKNLGYNDTTGHEIILRSLAMGKSDSNEFSHHNILLYSLKYMQTIDQLRTSIDPAQRNDLMQLALPWFIDGIQPPTFRQHVLTQDFKTLSAVNVYLMSCQQFPVNNNHKSAEKTTFKLQAVKQWQEKQEKNKLTLRCPTSEDFSDPSFSQLECANMPKAPSCPQVSTTLSKNISALPHTSIWPSAHLARKKAEISKKKLLDSGANISIVSSLITSGS